MVEKYFIFHLHSSVMKRVNGCCHVIWNMKLHGYFFIIIFLTTLIRCIWLKKWKLNWKWNTNLESLSYTLYAFSTRLTVIGSIGPIMDKIITSATVSIQIATRILTCRRSRVLSDLDPSGLFSSTSWSLSEDAATELSPIFANIAHKKIGLSLWIWSSVNLASDQPRWLLHLEHSVVSTDLKWQIKLNSIGR